MTFVVNATLTAKPGKAAQVLEYVAKIKKEADDNEKGNLHYYAAQSLDDENVIFIWEEYVDQEAFNAHRQTPPYLDFGKVRASLVEKNTVLFAKR